MYNHRKEIQIFTNSKLCCTKRGILSNCTKCKRQYVGETKRTFSVRFKEHKASIKACNPQTQHKATPVARHFNTKGHTVDMIESHIIEIIKKDPILDTTTVFRKQREMFWIHKFKTMQPAGINNMEC